MNKIIWEIVALKPLGSHSFHLVPVAEDTLCLLWSVPQGSEQQPGHHIRCFKLSFSEKPRPIIQVVAQHIFRMESARLCDAVSFPYNENCVAGSGGFFQVKRAKWQKRWRKKVTSSSRRSSCINGSRSGSNITEQLHKEFETCDGGMMDSGSLAMEEKWISGMAQCSLDWEW